jgi:uncharacterized repeat protein (TIGR03803 family)
VIRNGAGNLYGTTGQGGLGHGTVFELAADGSESVLHAFEGEKDGIFPAAGLIRDKAGNLYGTTGDGGSKGCNGFGCGTVYRLAPDGSETVLHVFKGGSDGAAPLAGLIEDDSGNLYGTTEEGGRGCNGFGCGTVFWVAPDGTETVLYAFGGKSDGSSPQTRLVADAAGNLYGTTGLGGAGCNGNGCGTVFTLAPDGTETVLHVFTGGSDGADPSGGLLRDKSGNLFGSTAEGGSTRCRGYGCGTVFQIAPDGTETVLHAFRGKDGSDPNGDLIEDGSGNLYGTTYEGGSFRRGTVFRLGK